LADRLYTFQVSHVSSNSLIGNSLSLKLQTGKTLIIAS